MGVGQTIDAAIRLYRSDWKTLMVIVALIVVPFTVIQAYAIHVATHPILIGDRVVATRSGSATVGLLFLVNFLVVGPLINASMVRAVAGIYLGQRPNAGQSIRFGFSKLGWVLLAVLLSSILSFLGLIALVVPGIILYIRYSFAVETVVVEGEKGGALGRSWRLSKGLALHIFGTLFVAFILAAIATAIFTIPSALLTVNGTMGTSGWVLRAALGSLGAVIVSPFSTAVGVLLYFDARIRKEGFDLAVMAREVGLAAP